MIVYRIQDIRGRGPFVTGLTRCWLQERPDHEHLLPWYMEIGQVHFLALVGMHVGCACETLDQLRRWFTAAEYFALKKLDYFAVRMEVGRILGSSDTQLVFERRLPLSEGYEIIDLYPKQEAA